MQTPYTMHEESTIPAAPARRRLAPAAALALLALLALLPATSPLEAARPRPIQVSGRVTDAAGEGVPGVAVRLIQGRRDFRVRDWRFHDEVRQELLTHTDADGFYEVSLRPDPEFRTFWLRFYDSGFDAVRYRVPEDVNISRSVRRARGVVHQLTLEDHPDWGDVEAWLARLGPGSDRARVVRRLGVPDRHEGGSDGGVEAFWYTEAGLVYRFQGGRFLSREQVETLQADAGGMEP